MMKQQVGSIFEQSDALTRANTLSSTLPHATDYLFAKPSKNFGLKFKNSEFRITLCRQLRIQIFDQTQTCIACNTSLMDTFGDHALSCSSSSDRISRHNDTRDLVFHACRSAGLSPVLEAKGLSESSRRRTGFGTSATSFLTVLAERCADNNLRDRAAEKLQLFQRINVAVHRSNANMVLSRVPTRELEPVNLRFCREKPHFTTCKRLRDDISEEGPLTKTPLCFVEVERESVN